MSLIITIDGPGGSGKSDVARLCAESAGGVWINSGQAYRLITWVALKSGWDGTEGDFAMRLPSLLENGLLTWECVSSKVIFLSSLSSPSDKDQTEIESAIGVVATNGSVRSYVNNLLKDLIQKENSKYFFLDGRDMGSVVFPGADLKIFLTASLDVRAERRLRQRSFGESIDDIRKRLEKRDEDDRNRLVGGLVEPEGCWLLVSSDLSLQETVMKILDRIRQEWGPISFRVAGVGR
ncbi:(d)CMP kinase [Candidatus Similichlamydia epinepheli]|uniref:(d)CMP kinase n=1 Tax=Candidatus Similichlamydia epinepheli TaxID=1903953 RepID=UPI000D372F7F|nr:(d)CMP kinase [Candidatus Similichlamydia epinepheli]